MERGYRTLDLLMTCYAMAKGSNAESVWETSINNYINSNGVEKDGSAKGANILIHTGVIYNNDRQLYFMTHMDAINFTMGMTQSANMSDKDTARSIVNMDMSKESGLIATASHNFYNRLREAYGRAYRDAPNATRTAWSGAKTYYGSTIINYMLGKRPKKNDWTVLENRPRPYMERLYMPIYSKSGDLYRTTYGMNVVLANAWVAKPNLKVTAEVLWADEDTKPSRKRYKVPQEQANINQADIFKFNFSTTDIAGWTALASKYGKAAVALKKVTRTTTQSSTNTEANTEAKYSEQQPMALEVIKRPGAKPSAYTEGDFVAIGDSNEFLELLQKDDLTLNIFSDAGTIPQEVKTEEIIEYSYDFELEVMLYNGTLSNIKDSYVFGDDESEILEFKETAGAESKRKLITVTAFKGVIEITPTPGEEKIYAHREFISEPLAYAELKEGKVPLMSTGSLENFEAMAGVPSTERLYFTSGGSEFIVEIYLQEIDNEETIRKYTSWFRANNNGSEFRPGDALKGGRGTYARTETFVADSDGKKQNKTVVAETSRIVEPVGATISNISINSHTSPTIISAEWIGTIDNNTAEPPDIGKFDPGKPGSPCPGEGFDPGTQRTKADPVTSWDVSAYNTALDQAIKWATEMEATNKSFTVERIADSDGQKRWWSVGDAVITVTMTGGYNSHTHTVLPSFSKNGSYTPTSAANAKVEGDDRSVLGSGWGWTDGELGKGESSGCCEHGGIPHKEWDVEPKPAVPPTYDDEGNMVSPGSPEVPGVKHEYDHSDSFTPGTDLTHSASDTINYSVKVTFKNSETKTGGNYDGDRELSSSTYTSNGVIAAHALCGPDCESVLPAVYDTWIQKLRYDYLRINAVNVYKISRSYVGGMEEITFEETENVIANINRGDPNIFYNIAEECPTYSSDDPKTPSLAGRVRYSLQSQQHDEVIWREYSNEGDMRTNKSDGMSKTRAGNPVPSGGKGHKDQKWAKGILYNNKDGFTEDPEWFENIEVDYEKSSYSANTIDAVDKETEEWKRFEKRRNTSNTLHVISDMLILQTSTGDQSVMYFTKSQTAKAQEHYGQDGELEASIGEMWDSNPNSASGWATTQINIGGYTGRYATPNDKFSSGSRTFKTLFDSDGSDLDATSAHPDPNAVVAGPKYYATVSNVINSLDSDNYKSSPANLQRRMAGVSFLKMVREDIQQNPINPNKEYITGEATQFYQNILRYERGKYEDTRRTSYKFVYEPELDDVLGYEGYAVDAVYAPGFDKINDIVVHTPVSVQNATIVAEDSSRDQRTELGLSSAENLMDLSNGLKYCPGTPELCDYRYLNCKYYQDVELLSLNFNPKSTIATIGSDGSATTKEIETVKVNIDEYGTKTTTVVDTIGQLEYELPPGFEIDKTNRFGTGDSLKAYGTRLQIPLSDLGLEYKPSNRIQVEFNFYMPDGQSGNTMVVSFYGYDFYIPDGNTATWNTGNGWERRVNGIDFSGTNMKIKLIFSMVSVDKSELYVNGTKVTDYTIVNSSNPLDAERVGEFINIGSWGLNDSYPAKFYIDNLVITKLAGTHTHDESCYTTVYNHQKFTSYTCQIPNDFVYKGAPENFTAPVSGWYKLEAWGASGGGGSLNQNLSSHGGLGGYATGKIYLRKGETIQVTVGGQGKLSTGLGTGGGYNGGGHGGPNGYGGGGASDIRKGGNTLDHRILVAGGGGGADNAGTAAAGTGDDGSGGAGGGLVAGNAYKEGVLITGTAGAGEHTGGGLGYGGNQVGGYRKGFGESATLNSDAAGAGGGYWGGLTANHGDSGAGGGSSYIGGVTDGTTIAGVHSGDGKVRITMLDHVHTPDCGTDITDYNVHVHSKNCITAASSELYNALKLAEQGQYDMLKTLLGNTVYNALRLPSQIIYTWKNWTTTDFQQFRALNSVKLSVNSSGNLVATSTGPDPYFDVPVKLTAASVDKIRVYARLVGTTSTYSTMLFTNENYLNYTTGLSVTTNINANNNWQWIEFDVSELSSWRGAISGLRFDIVGNNNSSGHVEIGEIQLVGAGSATSGTATRVLQTYSGFGEDKKYGITDGASASVTTFTGGNVVNSGNLTGMEFHLPVDIDSAAALQFIRVTMATDVGNYGGVYKNGTLQPVTGVGVNNGNGTHTVVYDVRHWDGAITSIGFDTASGTVTGTTKVTKIELIGYGTVTTQPSESYTSGAYDAHIHTQDCIYTPGGEGIINYTPVALTKQHHTSNGGYTEATGWYSFTSNPGDPQRMYNGVNIVSLTSPIDVNSYVRIRLSNACLSYKAYYYNFQIKINGQWMTLQNAQDKGHIHSAWVENRATEYTPHPSPNNILTGGDVGVGEWSGLDIYLYTGNTYKIEDIKVSAYYYYYYPYGDGWHNMSKPGDGIWVESGKLTVTNKESKWTTCTGVLNTYSDLVGTVTPVKRVTGYTSNRYDYTGNYQIYAVPVTGTYTLEAWGAQGGGAYGTVASIEFRSGGLGGYAKSVVDLLEGQILYIYAGGKGGNAPSQDDNESLLLNNNGGWNGGGSGGGSKGPGGGGASDVRLGGTALANRIVVAAGGGGDAQFTTSPTSKGSTPLSNGVLGYGSDGAYGEFASGNIHDTAGGGGGYYGGVGGYGDYDWDANAGTNYSQGTGSTNSYGVNLGHGCVIITGPGDVYYTGPDYVAPPPRNNYTYTPVKIKYVAPSVVSTKASISFGSLNGTHEGVLATISAISGYYNQVPQTIGGKLNPIFSCREVPNIHVDTPECEKPVRILTCTEPHHYGAHYDASNPICWDPCNNDANHRVHLGEVKDEHGGTIPIATFINTDYRFEVYFPNTGDFYQSDWHGIGSTTNIRGKGYYDNMDTTRWIREKRIMFTYDVLFYNNGTWEQHLAGDWIELPVTGDTYPYYKFYCTLNNNERAAADVYYEVEAINAHPSPGGKTNIYARDNFSNNDNYEFVTNAMRFLNLTAYHGAFKRTYVDLVGRIGNLLISDTDDMRFSNFFKTIKSDEWIVNGLINAVFTGDQARYLSWHSNSGKLLTDIRGVQVARATGMYNTWGTQKWTEESEAKPLPLSSEKNNIAQLRDDPLKPGYSVIFEISTQGDYEAGLQILPYFYALNTKDGTLIPVDVWMTVGAEYRAVNIHKLSEEAYYWDIIGKNNTEAMDAITDKNWVAFKKYGLFDYILNLDWVNEKERRNFDFDEQLITEKVARIYTQQVDNGTETVAKLLDVPLGSNYALGTLQLLKPNGRARTFIGSQNTNTANINGGTLTNIEGLIDNVEFNFKAQRWHLKLGLPSSAVITKYVGGKHLHPTELVEKSGVLVPASEELTGDDWVILMTADIKSIGSVWNLQYDQGMNNGVINVGGNIITMPANIPTVLAVYDSDVSSTVDVDIIGTH